MSKSGQSGLIWLVVCICYKFSFRNIFILDDQLFFEVKIVQNLLLQQLKWKVFALNGYEKCRALYELAWWYVTESGINIQKLNCTYICCYTSLFIKSCNFNRLFGSYTPSKLDSVYQTFAWWTRKSGLYTFQLPIKRGRSDIYFIEFYKSLATPHWCSTYRSQLQTNWWAWKSWS